MPSHLGRVFALAIMLALLAPATPLRAAPPPLSLPTPPGEQWRIIQGYACGSHNSWDRYSLDLVAAEGRTTGAPVRAAADGVIFIWVRQSGTLILSHGGGLYTMYTHMERAENPQVGRAVARGETIGSVGDRGSPGTPHLHFTAFTAEGAWARNRRSIPLTFTEGYELPEIGGCNQHGGRVLVASGSPVPSPDTTPPQPPPALGDVQLPPDAPAVLRWQPGSDEGVGIAGYRIYIGPDPQGTSDWFVTAPEVEAPPLVAGQHLLRVQPIDAAGNQGPWLTLATLIVAR